MNILLTHTENRLLEERVHREEVQQLDREAQEEIQTVDQMYADYKELFIQKLKAA